MLNSDANKSILIRAFPKLATDSDFVITGKCSPDYNCIAWAGCHDNVWWWPIPEDNRPLKRLDGVTIDWPFGAANNTKLETFTYVFSQKGYELCDNGEYEIGYRKICIYGNDTDNVTHAARQYTVHPDTGKWTSKLGDKFQITHGAPQSIEGAQYGRVLQFMKCKWP